MVRGRRPASWWDLRLLCDSCGRPELPWRDADEAAGLSGTVAPTEVIEHGTGLLLRQVGAKQCSAFAFGEAVLAGPSVKEAEMILLAEAAADRKVACTATAVKRSWGPGSNSQRGRPWVRGDSWAVTASHGAEMK